MVPAIGTTSYLWSILAIIAAVCYKRFKHLFKSLLLFIGLITGRSSLAQEYTYIHYDVKDGLPASTVYDLCQDKDGFIWFATDAGISRFDGTNFKNFTTADGLPETEVVRLFADSKGRVWMSPFKNSICYYYKGRIHNQDNDKFLKRINISNVVMDFAESPDGSLAFSTGKAGYVIRSDTVVYEFPHPVPSLDILLLNTNPSGKGFQFHTDDTLFTFIEGKIVSKEKCLGLSPAFLRNNSQQLMYPPMPTAHSTMPQKDKLVFVNTYFGSWMVDTVTYSRYQDVFLKGKQISHTLIDNEKNIWFSTLGEGVYKLASREFKTWYFKKNATTEVFSLEKIHDKLWVGTRFGKIYTITGSRVDTMNYERFFLTPYRNSSSERVVYLKRTKSGMLIAGFDGFLIKENGKEPIGNPYVISNKSVDEVDDHTLLVATARNLLLIQLSDLRVKDTILTHRSTVACYYNNAYYMGTINGLYKVTTDRQLLYLGNLDPALRNRISHFVKSPDGSLWVGTYGGGAVCIKNDQVIRHITTRNGLSSDICRSMFLRDNNLWVGTDKGLNKIPISQPPYSITTYTTSDGLPNDVINAIYVDGDTVYVGSPAGLTLFNETKVTSYSKCNLQVLNISVSNKPQPIQDSYQLKYRENSLKISFAGISFKSGGEIRYRYRLKGLTDIWDSTRQTVLEYPSLPPGEYRLELIAINKKGVISNPIYISFNVEAAFWQTLPFQILVIAVAILVTWILVAWRFSIIRKQEQEKTTFQQRLNDLEQMALRAQMNPHFIFNCLNSIQNFIINNNLEASNQYLTEFAHLIRQTLDNSEKGTISIANEVKYLKRYLELEMMRFGHSFNYSIEVDNDIDQELTYIPTMILQPYIENSIRHGIRLKQDGIGQIEIKFKKSNGDFICIIQDNGIGRKKAEEYKSQMHVEYQSKGMSLTAERINILNRQLTNPISIEITDLTDNHNQPSGTRITIRFPGAINFKPVRNDTNRYN
jgi:ligand-binding sensor domain-containing protein/two-component sensor histidine kinase